MIHHDFSPMIKPLAQMIHPFFRGSPDDRFGPALRSARRSAPRHVPSPGRHHLEAKIRDPRGAMDHAATSFHGGFSDGFRCRCM